MSIFTDKNNLILRLTFSTSENVLLCADRQHKKKNSHYSRLQTESLR